MECITRLDGMHDRVGWDALQGWMECMTGLDGMYYKVGWNALQGWMGCITRLDLCVKGILNEGAVSDMMSFKWSGQIGFHRA